MGIFKSATEKLVSKEVEYKLHEKVVKDLAEGNKDLGVWGKAFVDAEADEKKAEAVYISLMVQHYKDTAKSETELEAIWNENYQKEQAEKEEALREARQEEALREAREKTHSFIADFLTAIVYIFAGLTALILIGRLLVG